MAKMKGEPPNRSKNYNNVFTPGQVQEGGSLGYAIANLLRGLARSQAGKTATKSQFPKSNVKVVKKPSQTARLGGPKKGPVTKYPVKKAVKKAAPKVAPKRREKTPAEMERDIERAAARKEMIAKKKAQAAKIRSSREWAAKRS
jgi:hypothetical protein